MCKIEKNEKVSQVWQKTVSDIKVPILELWQIWDTPLLLLSGPLWSGVVVPVRISSVYQILQFKKCLQEIIDTI